MHYEPVLHIVLHQPEIPRNQEGASAERAWPSARNSGSCDRSAFASTIITSAAPVSIIGNGSNGKWSKTGGNSSSGSRAGESTFAKTAERRYSDVAYQREDVLVFGCETKGLPRELLDANPESALKIPIRSAVRGLNLSNSTAIVAYEAVRQFHLTLDG